MYLHDIHTIQNGYRAYFCVSHGLIAYLLSSLQGPDMHIFSYIIHSMIEVTITYIIFVHAQCT